MAYSSRNDKSVRIQNLICVVETEKSFGVLPQDVILANANPAEVSHKDHAKTRFENMLVWIPKSQLANIDMRPSDIFPNLQVNYPSKFNPSMIPYKTQIDVDIKEWLAAEKGFISKSNDEDGDPPASFGGDSNEPPTNYSSGW